MAAAGIVKAVLLAWNYCVKLHYRHCRTAITVISSALVFCAVFFCIYTPYKKALTYVPSLVENFGPAQQIDSLIPKPAFPEDDFDILDPDENFDPEQMLSRDDVQKSNILNNRQMIWSGYLESLHGSRLIFGLSPRNAVSYITENNPDNYIAKTKYIAHSDYIAVIAYTGLAGTAVVLLFAVLTAMRIFRKLKECRRCDSFYMMTVSCLCGIGVFGLSYMDVLFCSTLTGVLFWMLLSVVAHYEGTEAVSQNL